MMWSEVSEDSKRINDEAKKNVRDSLDTINKGFGSLAEEGKHLAGVIGQRAKVGAADVKARVEDKTSKAISATRGQVRRTPGVALGVAAGIGALLALLATSRR
jgi:ElaB/YqjD/DUF883 family membrane-anchored ribosome-binding protein